MLSTYQKDIINYHDLSDESSVKAVLGEAGSLLPGDSVHCLSPRSIPGGHSPGGSFCYSVNPLGVTAAAAAAASRCL